jgi:hypothetical protein
MAAAYPMQLDELTKYVGKGGLVVETMGDTGRRFKRLFKSTPAQAQVMLQDPFGNPDNPERTVWYQSKYYRANLHFRGNQFYLRDLHVYSDAFEQPYLTEPVRHHGIEQRLLAALDGYHWSDNSASEEQPGQKAMGLFALVAPDGSETRLDMLGVPTVSETAQSLTTVVPLASGGSLIAEFKASDISFSVIGAPKAAKLALIFEWSPTLSALTSVTPIKLNYKFRDFDYSIGISNGIVSSTQYGATVLSNDLVPLKLLMAQNM